MEQDDAAGRPTCLELAREGEMFCRRGKFHEAIPIFLKALSLGSEDLMILSAIYCQLGNAYYSTFDLRNAYKYHCYDMMIAKLMNDRVGEAKACGNIGHVLKLQNLFGDAIMFTCRQVAIATDLENKDILARAFYNLGAIYLARAKLIGENTNANVEPIMSANAAEVAGTCTGGCNHSLCLRTYQSNLTAAFNYYCRSACISLRLSDHIASGRVYGSIGNVLHLLGDYKGAIDFHEKRLSIAVQFGDHDGKHRAYINLGNAHILLSKVKEAIEYYKLALNIAVEKCNKVREARCSFYIANASCRIADYSTAAAFHLRHLVLARELKDFAGMARAYTSLAAVNTKMAHYSKAAYFLVCSRALAKQMSDENMVTAATKSLKRLVEKNNRVLVIEKGYLNLDSSDDPDPQTHFCRVEMTSGSICITFADQPSSGCERSNETTRGARSSLELASGEPANSEDAFLDFLSRVQSSRLDEQRCDISVLSSKVTTGKRQTDSLMMSSNEGTEALIDLLIHAQGRRMDEQRATLLPGLKNEKQAQELIVKLGSAHEEGSDPRIDETLIDLLMNAQEQRMNDQRSDLGANPKNTVNCESSLGTTAEDDFSAIVMRMQAGRLEEQRAHLKTENNP